MNLRKTILGITLAMIMVITVFSTEVKATEGKVYNKVIMVYMIGSDLESEEGAATSDLIEMLQTKNGKDSIIVINTGGTYEWQKNNFLPRISNEVNQIYIMKNGIIKKKEDLEDLNMGESKTFSDFLDYTMTNFKAKKYDLVMWSHGSGPIYGFGSDEIYDDGLNLEELQIAFQTNFEKHNKKIENIIFDACLMSNFETALTLSKYANYMMASEEYSPSEGLKYEEIFNTLVKDNDSKTITKRDLRRYSDYIFDTISVLNLSKMQELSQDYSKLLEKVETKDLKKALIDTLSVGGKLEEDDTTFDLFDIEDLVVNLYANYPELSKNVLKSLDKAVIIKANSEDYLQAGGLSVYIPMNEKYLVEEAGKYLDEINLPKQYYETIRKMGELVKE